LFDENKYNVAYYMPRLDREIPVLNRNGCFLPFGMLDMLPEMIPGDRFFVRPNSGLKTFPGQVLDLSNPTTIKVTQKTYHIPSETLCWCSPEKYVDPTEWRVWINRGEVLAWTPYSWDQEPEWSPLPESVRNIAEAMSKNPWQPDLAYVVDVGVSNGDAFLMELNAASTSGLYNVPLFDLLKGLRETCILEAQGVVYYEEFSPM
ncbi:MAG TPA: ATP-grasp domain-containing protein, partial [Ignavibacteriaceae bacterium]